MRCLCSKSESYTLTPVKTPKNSAPKTSGGLINGRIRASSEPARGSSSVTATTNPGNTGEVVLYDNNGSRYIDTSKKLDQEFRQRSSTSKPENNNAISSIEEEPSQLQNGIKEATSFKTPSVSSESSSSTAELNGASSKSENDNINNDHNFQSKITIELSSQETSAGSSKLDLNNAAFAEGPSSNINNNETTSSHPTIDIETVVVSSLEVTDAPKETESSNIDLTNRILEELASSSKLEENDTTSSHAKTISVETTVEVSSSEQTVLKETGTTFSNSPDASTETIEATFNGDTTSSKPDDLNNAALVETNITELHNGTEDLDEVSTTRTNPSIAEISEALVEVASSHSEFDANHEVTTYSHSSIITESGESISQIEVTISKSAESSIRSVSPPLERDSKASQLTVPSPTSSLSRSSSINSSEIMQGRKESVSQLLAGSQEETEGRRRSGVQVSVPTGVEGTVDEELPVFVKSPEDEENIKKAIEKNEFLSKILSGKRLKDIINSMQLRHVAAKKTLIKQGEKGSEMFVSKEGRFKILVKGKMVGEFSESRVFGELAILYNAKRLATIQAVTAGQVWVLDRHVYQKIVIGSNLREQDENLRFLQNVAYLNVVSVEVLRQVSNLLKPEFFTSGTVIIRQGDKGDKFYIIRAGTVAISKTGEGVLGKLGKGQCFGEMALQKEDTRQATVTAEAPGVECLTLTRRDFIDHFGDVEIPKIEVKKASIMEELKAEYQDIRLEDLKIIRTLGVGGFGRVELVQHKKQKSKVFALKYLKKIDIVHQGQQEHVYNEKIIQMNCRSPFIVRLYRTYKDNKYVYFLMESCLGGDLFSLLHKQKGKRFDEKDAKFLSACVIEALEHLHSKEIVYRDLKPENLLVDKNGYLKLTDFGFAKKMTLRGKTFTFAGTPEYVAPEIVLNRGHDRAVDYWAFGAFVFELLTGRTPFRTGDSSHMRTYNKILNGIDNVNFPTYVNPKARNLIEKLCRPVPAERLGMQRGGPRDIKAHKWYQGFDWQKFQQCTMPSSFKPKLKDVIDTSNFDLFKQDKDYPPDETSGWDVHF